jgi:hypothetical protein
MKMITLFFAVLFLISCSTDYDGNEPAMENPTITINESGTTFVNSFVRVDWIGVIGTETDMDYYYCVTTDTSITAQTALTSLSADKWLSTKNNYADISFPMAAFNSDVVFYKDSVYQDLDSNQIEVKIAFSKIFVYAQNSIGTRSPVSGRLYSRINQKPKLSFIRSDELNFNLDDEETIDIYEDKLILPEANSYSTPIDFEWFGEDKDLNSKIEFKWELWENDGKAAVLVSSADWGDIYGVEINDEIYNNNPEADYSFKLFIRDDALDEGDMNYTVSFSVFTPTFDKGILLIDDTDPLLYPPSNALYMGNPDAAKVRTFYEDILEYAGYKPEGEAADSLSLYRIRKFGKGTEFIGWEYEEIDDDNDPMTPPILDSTAIYSGIYRPELKELSGYRLVIIASEDRGNVNGVDFAGFPPYPGYITLLKKYLDVGGKTFMLGNSALMGKLYSSPDQLPVNKYKEPLRYLFDGFLIAEQQFSTRAEEFFRDYFGIYAMTFPEQKTYFTLGGSQICADHYLSDNYDFIGIEKYDHVTDITDTEIRIDSVKVNDAWWNRPVSIRTQLLALKDKASVFTGVPTLEAFKGEPVYKYKSIYDLPKDDSLSYEISGSDTLMTHYLWCKNRLTGEIVQPVLQRLGIIATRYIADSDRYRTAFFGMPTYFLDNSENQVSGMFKAMIDWFDLEKDPLGGVK